MISSKANLVYELPDELSNELRLRILVNKEISGKSQIWVETCPVSLPVINFGNNSQKTAKVDIKLFFSILFLIFFPGLLVLGFVTLILKFCLFLQILSLDVHEIITWCQVNHPSVFRMLTEIRWNY